MRGAPGSWGFIALAAASGAIAALVTAVAATGRALGAW